MKLFIGCSSSNDIPKDYLLDCNDEPIFHFMCKDVKTGVDFILGSCFLLMKHQVS